MLGLVPWGVKMAKLETLMKRLNKVIDAYDNASGYEIPERFTAQLLDLGYIQYVRETQILQKGYVSLSYFAPTDLGRKIYHEWALDNILKMMGQNDP